MIRALSDIAARALGPSGKLVQVLAGPDETSFANLLVGVTSLSKGQRSGPARHGGEEIYFLLEGLAHISLGNEQRTVQAETLIAIRPYVEHTLEAVSERVRYLWVLAPPTEETLAKLKEAALP